jgi:hypothetical protein
VPQHWKNCVHEENVLLYKIEVSKNCSMWGSHGGEHEDGCLLGCSAV